MVLLGSHGTTTVCAVTGRAFWCLLPQRFASLLSKLGSPGFCRDHPLILFYWLSSWRILLSLLVLALGRLSHGFCTIGKLERCTNFPKVIRAFFVFVHVMVILPSLVGNNQSVLNVSMDEPRARIFSPDFALSSDFDAMGGGSRDNEPTPYLDDEDGYDLDLAEVPVDSYVEVRARNRGNSRARKFRKC